MSAKFRVACTGLLVALTAAALVGAVEASSGRSDVLPTRAPGALTVGVDIGTIGLAEGSTDGKAVHAQGFEIDLARALATKLGLKLRLVDVPFATISAPGPKRFDVSISHVTITAKRAKSVDFSAPYFVVNKGVLVAPGVPSPASLAELQKLQICAQAATTSLTYVQTTLRPKKPPHVFPSPADVLRALSDGYCQAMIADLEIVVAAKRDQPDLYGPVAAQIATKEHYGAVFAKGSKLRGPVSRALQSLTSSGAIERLSTKWFGADWNGIQVIK